MPAPSSPASVEKTVLSEQFRLKGEQWATLDAAARRLEEGKSAFLARQIAKLDADMPHNRAEQQVKASKKWMDYIKAMCDAKEQANKARIELESIRMQFTEWNNQEANARAEKRL